MLHRTNHVTPVDRLAKRGENKRLKEVQARHCKVWCNGIGSTRSKSGVHGKKVSPFALIQWKSRQNPMWLLPSELEVVCLVGRVV